VVHGELGRDRLPHDDAALEADVADDAGDLMGWEVAAPLFAVGVENVIPSNRDELAHEAVWSQFQKGHLDFSPFSAVMFDAEVENSSPR